MRGWLTKSDIPERVTVCISLPDSEAWQADFRGAFLSLTISENWEEHDALSSEEMADEWRAVFFDFVNGACSMIPVGTVMAYAGTSEPEGFVFCRGQSLLVADYPALYNIVGGIFGDFIDEEHFNIPDFRRRVALGVDVGLGPPWDIGDEGGELAHTLTVGEMPIHTHTQSPHSHLNYVVNGGVAGSNQWRPVDAAGAGGYFPSASETAVNQNSGSGNSHNNTQPYLAVNYMIKY